MVVCGKGGDADKDTPGFSRVPGTCPPRHPQLKINFLVSEHTSMEAAGVCAGGPPLHWDQRRWVRSTTKIGFLLMGTHRC